MSAFVEKLLASPQPDPSPVQAIASLCNNHSCMAWDDMLKHRALIEKDLGHSLEDEGLGAQSHMIRLVVPLARVSAQGIERHRIESSLNETAETLNIWAEEQLSHAYIDKDAYTGGKVLGKGIEAVLYLTFDGQDASKAAMAVYTPIQTAIDTKRELAGITR